jgi:uncharacterized membrane protein
MVMSGGLTALSGCFLLFHHESHFAKAIHQIGGILLIIFAIMHIVINWRALRGSLSLRFMAWAAAVFAVCLVIMAVTGERRPTPSEYCGKLTEIEERADRRRP